LAFRPPHRAISLIPARAFSRNLSDCRRAQPFWTGADSTALDDLNAAIKLDAKSNNAFYYRARVFEALGRKDEANADFRQALVLDPNDQDSKGESKKLGANP
jgi:tetratricopeptide (TPR) repeat protein